MSQKDAYQNLLKKITKIVEEKKLDLSADEDLAIAVMNLISLEEHLFFTFKKTEKEKYLNLLKEVREMRKSLLKKIIGEDYEGEVWCIQKHFLAATMRLIEVGTKKLQKNQQREAQDLFEKAYRLWSLFWALNLKLISFKEIKGIEIKEAKFSKELEKNFSFNLASSKKKEGFFKKLNQVLKKVVNCCKE